MLQNTFIHLPRISGNRERSLWEKSVLHWDDLEGALPELQRGEQGELLPGKSGSLPLRKALDDSYEAFEKGDTDYFAELLPPREHFRIALTFPEKTAFLDIETTGLSHYYDTTTVIGASIGDEYQACIQGGSTKQMRDFLAQAKCLITFNGKIFDLRFLRNDHPEILLPKAHVDLRFFAKSAGLSGGQKAIEQALGVRRASGVEDILGEKAPMLWHEYRLGDMEAVKQLIRYNHADVEGMKYIMDAALERLSNQEPILGKFERPQFVQSASSVSFAKDKLSIRKNCVWAQKFKGRKGPSVHYDDLAANVRAGCLKVAGIDLSGSEKKASGWCLLEGKAAKTELLHTDKEIIARTVESKPDIVSIDSPLSLPEGRTKVTDDDPKRNEAGIMRQCERELKRRGVNVYPALIPSMQKLTARGIRLAKEFRKRGLPVIESYPGAAQDIMNIPRKRAGLHYLAKGLSDFGIEGKFDGVSHDELDAVTSALVGLFFWAGKFEALGVEAENCLIIPDLEAAEKWKGLKVVGLSGPMATGKTTAGEFLEENGFTYSRYSLALEKQLKARGKEINRASLQRYGDYVHKRKGQHWLGFRLLELVNGESKIAIDGLRFPEDHAFLVENFGPAFTHIFIDTSKPARLERYIARDSQKRTTEREFEKAEKHPVEAGVNSLKSLASRVLQNNDVKKFLFTTLLDDIEPEELASGGLPHARHCHSGRTIRV